MQEIYKDAGLRIRKLRKMRAMTRDELAEKCHITSKFLYEVETGKKGFSAATLYEVSKALGVSCDFILMGEKQEEYNRECLSNIRLFEAEDIEHLNDVLRLLFIMVNNI